MANWLMPKNSIDFVGMRKAAAMMSVVLVSISLGLFFFVGPTWGIDFTGGTEMHLKFQEDITIADLRTTLSEEGLTNDSVQQINDPSENEFVVRIQDPEFGTDELQANIESNLTSTFGADWIKESTFDAQIGARLMVTYNGEPKSVTDLQNAVSSIDGVKVEESSDDNKIYIKIPSLSSQLEEALQAKFPGTGDYKDASGKSIRNLQVLQVDSVGPKVGAELRQQGLVSILATLALILVYVAFRFNLSFAPGAVLALFHDVSIVVGVFVALDMMGITYEFNLPMIGALLTIIGYSLNDTIVIYDRLRENMTRYRRKDLEQMINVSINETLGRTLATSVTTLAGMTAFLILGGPVIQTFALAIFLGVIVGTYSTIFVASPTILVMQDLQPVLGKMFSPLTQSEETVEDTQQ
jgi:preprotein translocase subunit SecF